MKAKPDAMTILRNWAGVMGSHAGPAWEQDCLRLVRALLRERAAAAHAATWNALASRVDTALLEHVAAKAEAAVLGRKRK